MSSIQFTYKGQNYNCPLIANSAMHYDCIAMIAFPEDTKPRLQRASVGYTPEHLIRVRHLHDRTTAHIPALSGRIILSHSMRRAWLDDGYCHSIKTFNITD